MPKISGIIICRNEETNIEDCIKSILWCDEVIVVDSFSSDRTIDIAKKHTDKIFQNEWKGFAEQRRFALSKVNYDWVFSLDADERCTKELEDEIKDLMSSENISENGFKIPRKSFFLDRWVRHGGWYPNYQLRLFRKDKVRVSDRLVHESYIAAGSTRELRNNILHYTVISLTDFVIKINNYSNLSALEKINKKKIGFIDIYLMPRLAFFQQYILKGNFLDGMPGLMVSKFHMMTKLLNNMKIWEIQNSKLKK